MILQRSDYSDVSMSLVKKKKKYTDRIIFFCFAIDGRKDLVRQGRR